MDKINKSDTLHFGADGFLQGITGITKDGEFTVYKDVISDDKLAIAKNDLYYTGDRICLGDVCLDKDNLSRISNFFNIKLGVRISDNFFKEHEELLNKDGKTVNDIFNIIIKLIEFYEKLLPDEKTKFIKDAFHNKIKLGMLGLVVDQHKKAINIMNTIKKSDINISRMEYRIGTIDILDINIELPYYDLKLSFNENPTRLIVFYDDNILRFAVIDYYILEDLELHYFNIYREKNLAAIRQVDDISIYDLKPHDLKILIDNMKSVSLDNGLYSDSQFIKLLCTNNINIDIYKLNGILYFPNNFIIKEFNIGEYESIRESIDGYLVGSLISKYIYLGNIDNYEVKLIKGEKKNQLSSKWKIFFRNI